MEVCSDRGVLVLGGPTASGKTDLAIGLAQRYGAEIVSADSRQIYRDMPVGTAAPTADQLTRARHHLVGFLDPYERYSAARFTLDALAAITDIHGRGKRAIVVGGTGFYLRALCGDVGLAAEPDPALRARVLRELRTHPSQTLHQWLTARNGRRAAGISPHDPYRIARALEIVLAAAVPADATSAVPPLATLRSAQIPYVKAVLQCGLPQLAVRIAHRTDAMLADGLLDEAERIGDRAVAADAVGYREALAFNRGWLTREELRTNLARATRRYAKRQLTWFRAEPDVTWIDGDPAVALDAIVAGLGWR